MPASVLPEYASKCRLHMDVPEVPQHCRRSVRSHVNCDRLVEAAAHSSGSVTATNSSIVAVTFVFSASYPRQNSNFKP